MTSLGQTPTPFGTSIRPLITDTNVLIRDIVRSVRQGHSTGLIDCATDLCVFAAQEVLGEIEERLPQAAATMKVSPDAAISVFREQYLPRIRWVDVPSSAMVDDPRLSALSSRDPSDLPTALLALLAGIKALSDDPDLVEYGLAIGDAWLAPILSVRSLNRTDAMGRFAFGASVELVGALARTASRVSPRGRLFFMAAGCLGGLALLEPTSRMWVKRTATRFSATTEPLRSFVGDLVTSLAADRAEHEAHTRGLLIEPDQVDALRAVIRLLLTSPSPLSLADISARLPNVQADDITRALTCTIFVRKGDGWQVGRLLDSAA